MVPHIKVFIQSICYPNLYNLWEVLIKIKRIFVINCLIRFIIETMNGKVCTHSNFHIYFVGVSLNLNKALVGKWTHPLVVHYQEFYVSDVWTLPLFYIINASTSVSNINCKYLAQSSVFRVKIETLKTSMTWGEAVMLHLYKLSQKDRQACRKKGLNVCHKLLQLFPRIPGKDNKSVISKETPALNYWLWRFVAFTRNCNAVAGQGR